MRLHQIQTQSKTGTQKRSGVIVGSAWRVKNNAIRITLRRKVTDSEGKPIILEDKPFLGPNDNLLVTPIREEKRKSERSPHYVVLAFPDE